MVQDIFPKKLDNQYKDRKPIENSRIIVFRERQVLIGRDARQNLSLPRFWELGRQVAGRDWQSSLRGGPGLHRAV